jgi:hypothetical protein
MKRLVEFRLDQGGSVLVEVDEPSGGPAMRGLGKDRSTLVEQADKTFEDATAAVTPAARSLITRLRSLDDRQMRSVSSSACRPEHSSHPSLPRRTSACP